MKRSIVSVFVALVLLLFCGSPVISAALAAAFPGAAGFGTSTAGGRGGKVLAVTNLNDSGAGSFRAACEASGARIVVFRTGGTIKIKNNIVISNPYITIAGQTAPGGGISLRGAGICIRTNDVIMRGIRIRVGDDPDGYKPENRDGLFLENNNGNVRNVVIDHCSISWAIDENMSMWYPGMRNITVSNCIISEALNNSLHPKGPHSMGPLVGPGISSVTFYGNLFAHNTARNPRLQGSNTEVINNVIYNRGRWDADIGGGTDPQNIVIIGNYFKKGPSFSSNPYPISIRDYTVAGSRVYADDNIGSSYTSGNLCDRPAFLVSSRPFGSSGVPVKTARAAYDWVLANAGANPQSPDPVDARVIREVKNGTGRIIDKVSEVGGWPTLATGTAPVDSDGDGMPDSWEIARGLNPNYAADANSDRDNDGYTNIEEYINSFYTSGSGSVTLQPPVLRITSVN
ncbi:MAG: pectate lyase [Desulfobacteraceae bacterium]|nr:MAG: pectate lyase [Desulfobacteraceae bacterium]